MGAAAARRYVSRKATIAILNYREDNQAAESAHGRLSEFLSAGTTSC